MDAEGFLRAAGDDLAELLAQAGTTPSGEDLFTLAGLRERPAA
jgi:hypothetical protein